MRKTFLLFAFATFSMAFAGQRSEQEMQTIAVNQLKAHHNQTRGADNLQMPLVKVLSAETYSIYAPQTGNGFVVVSSDDNYMPVLGYSNSNYSTESMPDGFRWWLSAINTSLKEGQPVSAKKAKTRGTDFVPVENFVLSSWGQDKPYNALTPKQGTKQSVTGCVATAMAQILNYYKYPETSEGVGSYSVDGVNTTNVDLSTTYMWDKILNEYNPYVSYSEEDSRPVAELMRDCGASAHMNYSAGSSGAYISEAALGFARNFKFNEAYIYYHLRDYYSQAEWASMIYNELMNKRPILYAGSDEISGGGHAFVFSGIDDEGRVYINWGWDGTANGFYNITDLAPTEGNTSRYNLAQQMLTGITIHPEEAGLEPCYSEMCFEDNYTLGTISVKNRINVRAGSFYNLHYKMFKGVIDLLFVNAAGEQFAFNFLTEEEGLPLRYGHTSNSKYVNVSSLPAGTYTAYLASKAEKDTYYQPVKCAGEGAICYQVTKNEDGTLVVSDDYQNMYNGTSAIHAVNLSGTGNGSNSSTKYIYSLNGQNMGTNASVLPKGVYIVNGKKIVK